MDDDANIRVYSYRQMPGWGAALRALPASFVAVALAPPYLTAFQQAVPWFFESRLHLAVYLVASFLLAFLVLTTIYGLLERRSRAVLVAMALLVLTPLGASELVHHGSFGGPLTVSAVSAVFYTDSSEATEFMLSRNRNTVGLAIAYIAIVFLVGVVSLVTSSDQRVLDKRRIRWIVVPIFVIVACIAVSRSITGSSLTKLLAAYPESDPWLRATGSVVRFGMEHRRMLELSALNDDVQLPVVYSGTGVDLAVLVVGESARDDHWSLYGYSRPTTPLIEELQDELYVVDSAYSPGTTTATSVPALLTGNVGSGASANLVAIAAAAGFNTAWVSNQAKLGRWDTPVSVLARDAATVRYLNTGYRTASPDGRLLAHFEELVASYGKQLLVVHILGSHLDYAQRVPTDFRHRLRPAVSTIDCFEHLDESRQEIVADYDQSIRYTDWFLRQVIELVRASNRSSIVVYTSDHGELLYDDSRLLTGHGGGPPEGSELGVPFVVWLASGVEVPFVLREMAASEKPQPVVRAFDILLEAMGIQFDENVYRLRAGYDESVPSESIVITPDGNALAADDVARLLSSRRQCAPVDINRLSGNRAPARNSVGE